MPFDISYGPIKVGNRTDARLNLALLRLACCCGLRASEIAKLRVGDVRIELARPRPCSSQFSSPLIDHSGYNDNQPTAKLLCALV
jgi:hypothetical protein